MKSPIKSEHETSKCKPFLHVFHIFVDHKYYGTRKNVNFNPL